MSPFASLPSLLSLSSAHAQTGLASYYGGRGHGMTCAHRTKPMGSIRHREDSCGTFHPVRRQRSRAVRARPDHRCFRECRARARDDGRRRGRRLRRLIYQAPGLARRSAFALRRGAPPTRPRLALQTRRSCPAQVQSRHVMANRKISSDRRSHMLEESQLAMNRPRNGRTTMTPQRQTLAIAMSAALLSALGGATLSAQTKQDKYTLKIARWRRLRRLQGIRRLVGGLLGAHRRSAEGDRRQSGHDRGVQGRHTRATARRSRTAR